MLYDEQRAEFLHGLHVHEAGSIEELFQWRIL